MANQKRNRKKTMIAGTGLELTKVEPKTENQAKFFKNYDLDTSQLVTGYPGTGKTFLAMYKAFEDISQANSEFSRIVIVRSAVPTRDVGFLPGTLAEKGEVYELPYKGICTELFGRGDAFEILKKHGALEFITTSFLRGLTLDRTIIIADEVQNMTAHEADSVVTRGGNHSKAIFCGDILQQDLTRANEKDIDKFLKVISEMPNDFAVTHFEKEDIVRSGLVKEYILNKSRMFPDGF